MVWAPGTRPLSSFPPKGPNGYDKGAKGLLRAAEALIEARWPSGLGTLTRRQPLMEKVGHEIHSVRHVARNHVAKHTGPDYDNSLPPAEC